jgi:excisionase family DNA binding protein
MDDLLTTKQLQDLLQVDRITIYRMLNDGRLRGFKVGGQWRFSRQEIEMWLRGQQAYLEVSTEPPVEESPLVPSAEALPQSCIQAIQAVYAEALDVAAITVDLDGTPLTEISNSCDFCNLVLSSAEGRRRCAAAWRAVNAGGLDTCHAGLAVVGARITVDGQWVANAASCQFTTEPTQPSDRAWLDDLPSLAAELGLAADELQVVSSRVRTLPERAARRIPSLMQRVADTFSEIGQERLHLLSRLQRIAEMSKI